MPPKKKSASVFAGEVFCVSGAFSLSQKEMKELIESNGGTIVATPNKTCTFVVSDQIGSAKTVKAQKDGIDIVTEQWVQASVKAGKMSTDKKLFLSGGGAAAVAPAPSDDDEEEEEEEKPKKKAAPKKAPAAKKAPAKKEPAKKAAASKRKKPAADDDDEEEEEEEDEPPKKAAKKSASSGPSSASADSSKSASSAPVALKTVVVKGAAPVDEYCPMHSSAHVFTEGSDVYDCMLNQTNIGMNNNKYYVIQLLESDSTPRRYWVWTRWGRVGLAGQNSLQSCFSLDDAKRAFGNKFTDKTKNHWSDRANFESYPGKYTLLQRDYSADDDDMPDAEAEAEQAEKEQKESKLDARVQELVKLICDLKMMKEAMLEVGYDANKLPLGKLSKDHIKKGYEVLQEIATAINAGKKGSSMLNLSNRFYTLIPHKTQGMRPPPVIDTVQLLKEKIQLVESLADVSIATNLLRQSSTGPQDERHPVDIHYEKLKCAFTPLERSSQQFKMVEQYTQNTHGHTHDRYGLEVMEVFDLDRDGEKDRFSGAGHDKTHNRQLLWHGSRLTNFVGIISQGLRIAPPEAPVTGYMFGKGVYFANMVSKSANYTAATRSNPVACMLLCEVALGDMNELKQADYHASNLPAGKLSTKGLGHNYPDPKGNHVLPDGSVVPLGKEVKGKIDGGSLLYDEFIVYNVNQIRMKYLVKMKFNWN